VKILRKFYSSIPLILIGGYLIKLNFHGGDDDCGGMPEAIITFFLSIIFLVLFIGALLLSLFRYSKYKATFNFIPLVTTGMLGILLIIAIKWNYVSTSKTILFATGKAQWQRIRIILKEDKTFIVQTSYIEYGCIHKGGYILHKDTLTFERDVQNITDSTVANNYLIDTSKRLLYPIKSGKIVTDSNRYFKISKETAY